MAAALGVARAAEKHLLTERSKSRFLRLSINKIDIHQFYVIMAYHIVTYRARGGISNATGGSNKAIQNIRR